MTITTLPSIAKKGTQITIKSCNGLPVENVCQPDTVYLDINDQLFYAF